MEQRFRERAERHGGGPVNTGEIDQKVSDEMKEFFAESAERAAKVVPRLDEAPGEGMSETTGEIRRKIDDFFAQVKDGGTTGSGSETRRSWQSYVDNVAGPKPASPAAGARPGAGAPAGGRQPAPARGGPDRARAVASALDAALPDDPPRGNAAARGATGPGPAAAAPDVAAPGERPKLDLRTALERARRPGGAPAAEAPAPPPVAATKPAPASPAPAKPAAAAPAPKPAPARPAAPVQDPITGPVPTLTGPVDVVIPPRAVPPAAASVPAAASGPAPLTGPVAVPAAAAPPRPAPPAPPVRPHAPGGAGNLPPRREPTVRGIPAIERDEKTGPITTSIPVLPPRHDRMRPGPLRDATAPRGAEPGADGKKPADAVVRRAGRPPRPHSAASAAMRSHPHGDGADRAQPARPATPVHDDDSAPKKSAAIRTSPSAGVVPPPQAEPPEAPADTERAPGPSVAAQTFRSMLDASSSKPGRRKKATQERAGEPADAPAADSAGPAAQRDPGDSFDRIFDEIEGLVRDTLKVPDVGDAAADASDAAAKADANETGAEKDATPPSAALARLKPVDDDDVSEDGEAPSGPYDWGVKKSPRPQGAWLVEDGESGAGTDAARGPVPAEPASPSPSLPPAIAAAEGAGPVGGRPYLIRKLTDEVRKVGPAVEALRAKGLVSDSDLSDPAAAADGRSPAASSDDMLSVESFAGREPVDLAKELSPARLVEELRRLRRLTDALVAKGVLSGDDLTKTPGE